MSTLKNRVSNLEAAAGHGAGRGFAFHRPEDMSDDEVFEATGVYPGPNDLVVMIRWFSRAEGGKPALLNTWQKAR